MTCEQSSFAQNKHWLHINNQVGGEQVNDLSTLYKMVIDFDLKLRNENVFNDKLYTAIYQQLAILFMQWEVKDDIPKSAFVSYVYLLDTLAKGNRFWSDEVCIKAEDAHIKIQELVTSIDQHPLNPI